MIFEDGKVTETVEKIGSSIVSIRCTRNINRFPYGKFPIEGAGSGIVYDPNGLILTNCHVIEESDSVNVTLCDGRTFEGMIVGKDRATDIALIRIDADNLPSASLGDSDRLRAGQSVLAIGNTLGMPGMPTVSGGMVSALGRPLPGMDFIFDGFIQTDAAINPGNSGGPLCDIDGNVIGINTAMIPFAQGIGFAIPINIAKFVAKEILEKGRVVRPWLGIYGTTVSEQIAKAYALPSDSGVIIAQIIEGSPAHHAGLLPGDILKKIGKFEVKSMKDLLQALSKNPLDEVVEIFFLRKGEEKKALMRLVESPVSAS